MTVRAAVCFFLLAGAVAGCATTPARARLDVDSDTPRRATPRQRDMTAEAYYHYAVAQLAAQSGQGLVRAEQPAEALTAARKAVQLAPDDPQPHLTLAELLRAQKKYSDAEAELEKAIALNPGADDAYLTLARY